LTRRYQATISWQRSGASFTDGKYSRAHQWSFDGGITVPASASPAHVPAPYAVAAAVDPEEALVASVSSCHLLWFLFLAAKAGYRVESYEDDALGVMEKNAEGRMAITRITLRPRVEFSADRVPSAGELAKLHHAAHDACYIASSLKTEISVESR